MPAAIRRMVQSPQAVLNCVISSVFLKTARDIRRANNLRIRHRKSRPFGRPRRRRHPRAAHWNPAGRRCARGRRRVDRWPRPTRRCPHRSPCNLPSITKWRPGPWIVRSSWLIAISPACSEIVEQPRCVRLIVSPLCVSIIAARSEPTPASAQVVMTVVFVLAGGVAQTAAMASASGRRTSAGIRFTARLRHGVGIAYAESTRPLPRRTRRGPPNRRLRNDQRIRVSRCA